MWHLCLIYPTSPIWNNRNSVLHKLDPHEIEDHMQTNFYAKCFELDTEYGKRQNLRQNFDNGTLKTN